jgi:hypothetical protein
MNHWLKQCMRAGFLSTLVVVTTSTSAAAQVPGTYRLTICARPCTEADTGVVRGHMVLLTSEVRLDTLSDSIRAALTNRRDWPSRPGDRLNACFSLSSNPASVNGRPFYAGIVPRGLTHWDGRGARVSILLYESPDAFYMLVGTVASGRMVGQGRQGNCCGGEPPVSYFLARRVSEPDINSCL